MPFGNSNNVDTHPGVVSPASRSCLSEAGRDSEQIRGCPQLETITQGVFSWTPEDPRKPRVSNNPICLELYRVVRRFI